MIDSSRANPPDTVRRQILVVALLLTPVACSHVETPAVVNPGPTTLSIAFGLTSGQNAQLGARAAVTNLSSEALIGFARDGRPQPRLAESWKISSDGLSVRMHLRSASTFHDGQPVTAEHVRDVLQRQLRGTLGPEFDVIDKIQENSPQEVEILLKRRSRFVLEGLGDVGIGIRNASRDDPDATPAGTGPFKVVQVNDEGGELVVNDQYYLGRPSIDRIHIKPYTSVRAAWADMLRGQVDMLYEVGPDALDLLEPSNSIKVVINQRNYAFLVILNVERPALRDAAFRRALNAGIDRAGLISEILKGHGTPAGGSVWPNHWAYDSTAPEFRYEPRPTKPTRLRCVMGDASHERVALAIQKQLHAIGVDMEFQLLNGDDAVKAFRAGKYDAILGDFLLGPTLLQPYRSWRSGGTRNWGHYKNARLDEILERVSSAADDEAYRQGVAEFQRAIVEDPPAIFIGWSERARAVSTRFDVPVEPGRDIIGTLRLWRPSAASRQLASRN